MVQVGFVFAEDTDIFQPEHEKTSRLGFELRLRFTCFKQKLTYFFKQTRRNILSNFTITIQERLDIYLIKQAFIAASYLNYFHT